MENVINKSPAQILQDILTERRARNQSYSLRAFARDLNLSTSRLSLILREKAVLTPKLAKTIVQKLEFNEEEKNLFCVKSEFYAAQDEHEKSMVFAKYRQLDLKTNLLSIDIFEVISNWYHLAIVELLSLKDAESSTTWIAEKLSLKHDTVEKAINRLIKLEILKASDDGKLAPVKDFIIVRSHIPHKAGQNFHRQILEKAINALEEQPPEKRNISTIVMKARKEDIPKLDEKIKTFRREMSAFLEAGDSHDAVYSLGIQLIQLDQ